MVALAKNRPVSQDGARLRVTRRLAPGRHRFSLVVVDDAGNRSAPDIVTVVVRAAPPRVSASPTPSPDRR